MESTSLVPAYPDYTNDSRYIIRQRQNTTNSLGFYPHVGVSHQEALEEVKKFIKDTRSVATSTTYKSAQRKYQEFCSTRGWQPYPSPRGLTAPVQLASYARQMARENKSAATINTNMGAIANEFILQHNIAGITAQPLVKQAVRAAAIATANKKSFQKKPIQKTHLSRIVMEVLKDEKEHATLTTTRDIALLLVMYYGALRCGEATNLKDEDLKWSKLTDPQTGTAKDVITISLPKSKTNQTGNERDRQTVNIIESEPPCAVKWLLKYLLMREDSEEGEQQPLFMSTDGLRRKLQNATVTHITKKWVTKLGLDPKEYASHSMRRGAITDAAANEATMDQLREHGRWATGSTVAYRYIEKAEAQKLSVAKLLASKK